jgi:enoyl-CoA hydratase/carnithine racemase
MREMMLTGRKFNAKEGFEFGLSHYLVKPGKAFEKAKELAEIVAGNAEMSNYMIMNALPRIGEMSRADGFFTESVSAAMTLTSHEAIEGIDAFLTKKNVKFDKK